jgi:3'-phosphoadenosine 5'-phosphosulfate sulfotransferase (PAPS reductase)/FAD synthetase
VNSVLLTLPALVGDMVRCGALVVLNDSGGKDSQAMRILVRELVPRDQLVVMHASLGDVEWPGALEHAESGAARDGVPFVVARATKTFFEMVEHRFAVRPSAPSWPSASSRQCTSDLKRGPIEREVRRLARESGRSMVINCMGIRSQESASRSKLVSFRRNDRNSVAGRLWFDWLPIHNLTRDDVLQVVADAGEQLHPAYAAGNDRLSCMFCIMGSSNDLRHAALANPGLYRRYVEVEQRTGYTMHMSRKSLPIITGIPVEAA